MPSIYQLTKEYEDLYEELTSTADEETGEIDERLSTALTCKQEEFVQKAQNYGIVYRKMDNDVEQIEKEIERLTALKKSISNNMDRMKNALSYAMGMLGYEKIDGISAKISFRNSEKTVIDDEKNIPEEYMKVEIKRTPDKTKIKNAIKNGSTVGGCHLEETKNIQIK